ncbi:MAG: crossover junction endodeoxyribonuclease RuvC [Gammaproteobacteria bacterium]|nr:crossover junction endodeoxyribonuclease RuvC [Gammaproteobacteria bacterium]MCP5409162.1 crossover junction endodeoxyribonuclease RuvC [Chromatiaceae bacterium]MCP5443753.1 crossover junction endodeoxyribonuclease RuvC [Chromatiaceae bacterium]
MRRILGIDPGSRVTGYGIIVSDGSRSRHIASGCIRLEGEDFSMRLGEIYRRIAGLVAEFAPEELAIEQVFVARNPSSSLKLGQARGAAICAAVVAGLPVSEYTPRMIKLSVVGTGGADKEQVQHMVRRLLGLQEKLLPDQADALAVAISHAHSSGHWLKRSRVTAGRRP